MEPTRFIYEASNTEKDIVAYNNNLITFGTGGYNEDY
jgi:hypothetical protein